MRSSMLAALALFVLISSSASAGEWLAGKYWRRLSEAFYPQPTLTQPAMPAVQVVPEESAPRTYDDILPIGFSEAGPNRQSPQPRRPAPPRDRIVAPNAWSAPLYR